MPSPSNLCKNCVLIVNRFVTNCQKLSPFINNFNNSPLAMWIIDLLSEVSLRSVHMLKVIPPSVKPRLSTFPTWLVITTTKLKKGSL